MAGNDDLVTVGRTHNQLMSQLIQAFTNFFNLSGTAGSFTMGAATSTVVAQSLTTSTSFIFLFPASASAGTLVSGANSPYVSSKSAGVSFTIATAGGGAAAGTEVFNYLLVNLP
ncbi:MAG TPA: hypothetical protein VI358_18000 [Pseudolabrys sp.]